MMRYATVRLDPGPEGFYPEQQVFIEKADVTRERIHHMNLLDDGTIVMLYQLRGDLKQAKEMIDDIPRVVSSDIAGKKEGLMYFHWEPIEADKTLLPLLKDFAIVSDMPMEITADGDLRATLIGGEETLQRALTGISDIVTLHLEKTGEYRPELHQLGSMLTDRQYQILQVAVNNGYYEIPRRATYEEIAEEVELSQSTVGNHLQKIEAKILPRIVF